MYIQSVSPHPPVRTLTPPDVEDNLEDEDVQLKTTRCSDGVPDIDGDLQGVVRIKIRKYRNVYLNRHYRNVY
jgi:hypothetical protein